MRCKFRSSASSGSPGRILKAPEPGSSRFLHNPGIEPLPAPPGERSASSTTQGSIRFRYRTWFRVYGLGRKRLAQG